MRFLSALLLFVITTTLTAGTRWEHRSEDTTRGNTRELHIIKDDDDYYARWERNGVAYITRDASVLAEIERALDAKGSVSRGHAEIGRKHAEIGREHAAIGREHARLGREHARAHASETRQRELERMQRDLERKQHALEDRQKQLETTQRELERKAQHLEREADRKIDAIFDRAIRTGKAKRD